MKKLIGKLKGLDEILAMEEIVEYQKHGIIFKDGFMYLYKLYEYIGVEVELNDFTNNSDPCDYFYGKWDGCLYFRKGWFEYIREEIDWAKVPHDTIVYVKMWESDVWRVRHYAGLVNDKPCVWIDGFDSRINVERDIFDCTRHYRIMKLEK